ncbi:helix-turn-helix domain-containing protein [Vampirovibrio sp.]|uniref:helix-turn-helix domain-containing protein n=1 Tax=Vampirovibrio sp. TaxID=2717857 RepID=UPI003593C549
MERQFQLNWTALVEEALRRRKALGLTQQRLAALASISTPTVSRFENHKEDIQLSSILAILKVLGMLEIVSTE